MDGPLVNHEQTNLNVKTAEGESALNLSYPDAKLVKLLLETGQLKIPIIPSSCLNEIFKLLFYCKNSQFLIPNILQCQYHCLK